MIGTGNPSGTAPPRRPLVVFAPGWPSRSGIAAYVNELMPYHLRDFDVSLVVADDAELSDVLDTGPRILLASEFRRHRSFFVDAPKLYHMGNNPSHCYMLDFVKSDPGILVLHDFNLNYMHQTATIAWGENERFRSSMVREYGVFGDENIRWHSERTDREVFATYEMPLNGQVLEYSKGIIAHSRYVQFKAAARVPHIPVWFVPHHLSPVIERYARLSKPTARRTLGLPLQPLIITALGFATRAKKLDYSLAALAQLKGRIPEFRFVIAGEQRPYEYDVAGVIESSGLKDLTICTDYLEESQFFQHLAASDLVVNLRYPSGGESSGTLVRALGMGIPTVVFDHGPMGELPDRVVRKVPWGDAAQRELTAALHDLMTSPSARHTLGANAAAHARNHFAIEKVAQKYTNILRGEIARSKSVPEAPGTRYSPSAALAARRLSLAGSGATDKLRQTEGRLWISSAAVPMGWSGHSALVVAQQPEPIADLLRDLFGWSAPPVTAMTLDQFLGTTVRGTDGKSLAAGQFEFALAIVNADMSENRSALLMQRLNAALRIGGNLTFEIYRNLDGKLPNRHLSEQGIVDRLRDAGFASIRRRSCSDGLFMQLIVPERDEDSGLRFACATASKTSDVAVWRYSDRLEAFPSVTGGRPH